MKFVFEVNEALWQDLNCIPGMDPIDELEDACRSAFLTWMRAWRDLEGLKRDGLIRDYNIEGDNAFIIPMAPKPIEYIDFKIITENGQVEFIAEGEPPKDKPEKKPE